MSQEVKHIETNTPLDVPDQKLTLAVDNIVQPAKSIDESDPVTVEEKTEKVVAEPVQSMPKIEVQPKNPKEGIQILENNEKEIKKEAEIKELKEALEQAYEKNREKEQENKFSFNKLFVGAISGKNPLSNSLFFGVLVFSFNFYTENSEDIQAALTMIAQGIAVGYPILRKYVEGFKKTVTDNQNK